MVSNHTLLLAQILLPEVIVLSKFPDENSQRKGEYGATHEWIACCVDIVCVSACHDVMDLLVLVVCFITKPRRNKLRISFLHGMLLC